MDIVLIHNFGSCERHIHHDSLNFFVFVKHFYLHLLCQIFCWTFSIHFLLLFIYSHLLLFQASEVISFLSSFKILIERLKVKIICSSLHFLIHFNTWASFQLVLLHHSFITLANKIQCDQIGRFIGLWATFKSLWPQLVCPNLPHS